MPEGKTFTQEELDEILKKRLEREKADYDKNMKALKKEKEELEKAKEELQRKHDETIEEYDERIKNANLTAEQKHAKDLEKIKKELEQKDSELSTIKANEIKRNMLGKYKLSDKFLNRITGNTEEEIETSVKEFSEAIGEYMKSQGGGTPGAMNGGSGNTKGITKEKFNKMSYAERVELYNTDKATYDALKDD